MAVAHALVVSSVLLVAQGFDYLPWQLVCNSSDGSGKGLVGGDIVTRYVDKKGLPTVVMDNLENNVNVKCTSSKGDPRIHFDEVDMTPPVPDSSVESLSRARGSVNRTLWKKNVTRFWKVDKVIKCNPGTMQSCSMRVIEVKDGNWVKGNCTVVRRREGDTEVMSCNIRDWVSNAMSARDTSACGKAGEDGSSMEKYFSDAEYKYSFRNPRTKAWTPCREFSEHSNGVEHKDEDVSHIKCNVTYQAGEHFLVRMEKTHHTPGSAALPMFGKSCKESAYFWVEGEFVEDDTHIKLPYSTVYSVTGTTITVMLALCLAVAFCFCRRHHYKHLYIREKSIKSQADEDTEAFTEYKNNSGFDPNYREEEGGQTKSTSFTTTITEAPAPTPTKPEDQINPELAITDMPHLLPDFDPRMELPRDQLKLGYFLGQGQFGRVYEGTATGLFGEHKDRMVKVAVKEIKDTQAEGWADELKILSNLAMHLNLVNLLGACTWPTSKPTYILLEYCSFGDLKKFMCKHKDEFESRLKGVPGNYESPYKASLLLRWSYDIAQGMKYLASMKIMHGDLAARNIMVGENFTAKVSDFGLSKKIPYYNEDYKKTQRKLIPWAWMASEYLKTGDFNIKSDVWSFGVVLWEIFTVGNKPYGINPDYEEEKVRILAGERLPMPELADMMPWGEEVYSEVMLPCWQDEARQRPDFTSIVERLGEMLGEEEVERYNEQGRGYKERQEERARAPKPPVRMDSLSGGEAGAGYIAMEEVGEPLGRHNSRLSGYSMAAPSAGGYVGLRDIPAPRAGYIEVQDMANT